MPHAVPLRPVVPAELDPTADRQLIEHAVEGIFRTTPDGRFLLANPALARMLGYETVTELLAERTNVEHQRHYVRPDERARFKRLLDAQDIVHGFEYEAYRRDGSTVWLRDNVRAVRDPAGRILYYEGMVQDVTNDRRAHELLDLRARQQATVARLGETALATGDLDGLLAEATASVAQTLEVEFVGVFELRREGELALRAGTGWKPGAVGHAVVSADGSSQAGFTLLETRPVIVTQLATERRFRPSRILLDHHVVSGMSVIIGVPERPYGVLSAHTTGSRVFTPDDVNFLQAVGSLLAAAVAARRAADLRQHLLARAISAQEEERQRVARELHDETGQALSAILVGLRTMADLETLAQAQATAHRLGLLAADTIRGVGRLARGLRPPMLDDLGLIPALRRYAEQLASAAHLTIRVTDDGADRLPPALELTLYRILQEALTNVAHHAGAKMAQVSVARRNAGVRATVHDDGAGFDVARALDPTARRRALGLVGMRERAALIGGAVEIASAPGAGTTITVHVPLEPGA